MSLAVHNEEFEVRSRLQDVFGFDAKDIQDVIMQGLLARTTCTKHHPRIFHGIYHWAETVRALRDKSVPLGWNPIDDNNFPLCEHPSGKLVVAVQTGDSDTGLAESNPSNRAAKGTNTEQAIWSNQKQLNLFDESFMILPSGYRENARIMWVLLYHVAHDEIRFELSLPLKMVGGKIRSWEERIVFPPIKIDQIMNVNGDDNGPEFDIHIERRN